MFLGWQDGWQVKTVGCRLLYTYYETATKSWETLVHRTSSNLDCITATLIIPVTAEGERLARWTLGVEWPLNCETHNLTIIARLSKRERSGELRADKILIESKTCIFVKKKKQKKKEERHKRVITYSRTGSQVRQVRERKRFRSRIAGLPRLTIISYNEAVPKPKKKKTKNAKSRYHVTT